MDQTQLKLDFMFDEYLILDLKETSFFSIKEYKETFLAEYVQRKNDWQNGYKKAVNMMEQKLGYFGKQSL